MSIYIENETDITMDFDVEEVICHVIHYTCDYMNCPYETEVNVVLTDNAGIHEINREYRNIDRPTDVLSFPMLEYSAPGDMSFLEGAEDSLFDPDTGELLLGDIMISLEKVMEQSSEYGHSKLRELSFLVVHSMLHLFGYDHMEEDERAVMEQEQKNIMNGLGIYR